MSQKRKIKNNIKQCNICHKYYDSNSINFFLNLAISKKIKDEENIKAIQKLKNTISNNSDIDWCYCYTKEKISEKSKAESYLNEFEKSYKNFNEKDIKEIGFDFFSNKNYVYFKNGTQFNKLEYYNFLKVTKNQLEYEEIFSFDFLNYEKMRKDDFIKYYKSYFNYPNFLVIDEMEFLNGKENTTTDGVILRNLLAIIKERSSNKKKTFVSLGITLENLKETFSKSFWDAEEKIYLEIYDILINDEYYEKMNMAMVNKNNVVSIKTQKPRKISKPIKKINKVEVNKVDIKEGDFD